MGNRTSSFRVAFIVILVLFLANLSFSSDAITAYRSNSGSGVSSPKVRFWNSSGSGSWGSEIELPSAGSPVRETVVKYSPVSSKIVLVTQSDDGFLDGYACSSNCTNASNWVVSNNFASVWPAAPGINSRRFDVEFETATGKAMIVYATNASNSSRDLAYRILPVGPLNISPLAEQYIDDSSESGAKQYTWVALDRKPNASSSELALIGFDNSSEDINAWIWSGSSWGNFREITAASTSSGGYENLAVKYAADGSKCFAIGGSGGNGDINGYYWNGSTWTASNPGDMNGGGGNNNDVRWVTLKADPATDDLQIVAVDTGPGLHTAYWSGSAWTITSGIDSAIDSGSTRPADFEWEQTGSTGRLVWDTDTTGTTISQRLCSPQCSGTINTTSAYAGTGAWLALYRNPTSSDSVKILGERLNNSASLGSFYRNASSYANYGDTAMSSNTTVSTSESYTLAFQLSNATSDSTAPNINLAAPADNATLNPSSIAFSFNATDNNSTLLNCSLYLDGSLNATNSSTQNGSVTSFIVSGASNGNHTWYVACADNSSNTGTSTSRNFTADSTPPSVALNTPINFFNTTSTTITFFFNATDNLALLMSCSLVYDGTPAAANASTVNGTLTGFQLSSLLQGVHTWYVACNDSANNTGTSATRMLTIDYTAPSVSQNSPANGVMQGSSINFSFTTTDALSAAMNCSLFIDGVYNKSNSSTQNNTPTTLAASGFTDGLHNWSISCNDSANNNGASATWNFTVDSSSPAVTLNAPANNLNTSSTTVDFNFTATDNIAPSMGCALLIDGATSATNASAINNTLTNFHITSIGQGKHNWTVSCNDTANNTATPSSRNFTVDTSAPTVVQNAPANGYNTSGTTVTFNFNATDNLAPTMGCILLIDGVQSASNASVLNNTPTNIAASGISQGRHNWTVSCNDSANNTGTSTTRNFTVDTTAPSVSLNSPANGATINTSSVVFNFTATDNLAPTMNCSLYIGDVLNATNTTVQNNTPTVFTVSNFSLGNHAWNVTCRDAVNNTGSSSNRTFFMAAVTSCPVITSSGTFVQVNNLANAPNTVAPPSQSGYGGGVCLKIGASNVVYDCNGYSITNDGTNNRMGVYINGSITNVTVKNCAGITGYKTGLFVTNTNNSHYLNNSISNTKQDCIYVEDSFNTSFTNNTATDCTQNGIYIGQGGFSTFSYNILLRSGQEGIHIANGNNNLFIGNVIFNSSQDGIQVVQNTNNTFINNTVNDNTQHGVHIVQSDINFFTGNIMNSNDGPGFLSVSSNNASFINNTACYNNGPGFEFTGSTIEKMVNNTFCNNDGAGLDVSGSLATFGDNHYFNNSPDFSVSSSGPTNITDDVFDAPGDNYQNYTNLTIHDFNTVLAISWSPPPVSLPTSCTVLLNKYVSISGSNPIDQISWHWLPADLAGVDVSLFKLARYNGSTWTAVPNQSLDIPTNTITITNLSDFGVFGIVMCNSSIGALKTVQASEVTDSANASFNITITNTGNATLNPVMVMDTLPSALVYAGSLPAADSAIGNTVTWNNVGPITAGGIVLILLNATANATNGSITVINTVNATGTDPIGFNVTANDSASVTLNPVPGGEGEEPDLETMRLSDEAICPGDKLEFKSTDSSGHALSGAEIRVIYDEPPDYFLAGVLHSDSSGHSSITLSSNGTYRIRATKNGYEFIETSTDFTTCPLTRCQSDSDCPLNAVCQSGACVPVPCECGEPQNHTCSKFQCCLDSNCPTGQTCISHLCVLKPGCFKDSDCADNRYCKIPTGASGGTCELVTGCGFASNHKLVPYECGFDSGCPSCPEGYTCTEYKCVQDDLTCPSTGIIGDTKTCEAKENNQPCAHCDYVVTDPTGNLSSGRTDEDGHFNLPLRLEGTYKVALLKNGTIVKAIEVRAFPKAQPVEPAKPTESSLDPGTIFPLLSLLLLIILFIIYWKSRDKGISIASLTKTPSLGKPVELIAKRSGSKNPVPDVAVFVALKGKTVAKGVTNAEGKFSFSPVSPGEYSVFMEGKTVPELTFRL
jgi:parallel beta-helix repeat protein